MNSTYFSLPFDKLSRTWVRPLTNALSKAGASVADVIPPEKAFTKDGVKQKKLQFIFDDGQSATLIVSEHNAVIQTRINGKITPIANLSKMAGYAKELASIIQSKSAKFQKEQERKAAAAEKSINTSGVNRASKSYNQRIVEANKAISSLDAQIAAESALVSELQSRSANHPDTVGLEAELEQLKETETTLMAQLASAQKGE